MSTTQILKLIEELPTTEKLQIAEAILRSVLEQREKEQKEEVELEGAAQELLEEYQTDKELTIFTELDGIEFYEEG